MNNTLLKIITVLFIIPLGIISKILFWLHSKINLIILEYKKFYDSNKIEFWRTIYSLETKSGDWKIENHYLDSDSDEKQEIKLIYKTNNGSINSIYMSEKQFTEFLNFATELNKKIIKNGDS